jgi:hypothetical protein
MSNQYEKFEARIVDLEEKAARLTKQLKKSTKANRKPREYTDEQRAAIRARLLVGQETARKKREAEAKTTKKVKNDKQEKAIFVTESNPGSTNQC